MNPIQYTVDRFINDSSMGKIGPSRPIIMQNLTGDQRYVYSFEDQCDKLCEKHNLDPLSLLRGIQGKINNDMLQRVNRSKILQDKLRSLLSEEWNQNVMLSDIFEDNCQNPFDCQQLSNEKNVISNIESQINDLDLQGDNLQKDHVISLINNCQECEGRLNNYQGNLQQNYSEYQPPMNDIWNNLAMKDNSYYRSGLSENPDNPELTRYADRQIQKVIPEDIKYIFLNGVQIPVLLRKYNLHIQQQVKQMKDKISNHSGKLSYIIDNLPEEDNSLGLLSQIMNSLGIDMSNEQIEDNFDQPQEIKPEDIQKQINTIIHDKDEISMSESEDEESDDEEESDEEESNNQKGGMEYYSLSLDKNKKHSFF